MQLPRHREDPRSLGVGQCCHVAGETIGGRAVKEAKRRGDRKIGCEHILLGVLRGGDKFTLDLLTEHVDVKQLRGAIIDLLDKAA